VIARGRVVVEASGGHRCRLACLRSEGPLVLRPTGDGVVHLVSGAGGPLGGDVLTIEIVVGPGAELTLRTVAAAVALPGPGPSVIEIDARVGAGGVLRWLPEPTVAAAGCDHRTRARVMVGAGARLVWREELVQGRHGEVGGSISSRLAVDVDGRPLVRHQVDSSAGDTWASPAVGAGARCVGTLLVVDPTWIGTGPPAPVVLGEGAALLPLAGPAVQVVALAAEAITLRRFLDAGEAAVSPQPEVPSRGRPGPGSPVLIGP